METRAEALKGMETSQLATQRETQIKNTDKVFVDIRYDMI